MVQSFEISIAPARQLAPETLHMAHARRQHHENARSDNVRSYYLRTAWR
jgi:hypothetical protein